MTPSCDTAIADTAWNFVFDDKSVSPYCADESALGPPPFILILNALPAAPFIVADAQGHGVVDCVPALVDGVIIIIGVAGMPLFPLLPPPPLRVRFTVFAVEFVLHSHV